MSNIPKRRAIRILRRAGYEQDATGKHELWTNGKHQLSLPHKPVGGELYGWLANQIRKIEAGEDPAKVFKRGDDDAPPR